MSEPVQLLCGDARTVLDGLPAQSVHCAITSPSYYGLRDYGCDGQIGLEDTPQEYVSALVAVFRGVWRVLRDDGTLWIVIGDAYAGSWGNQGRKQQRGTQRPINGPILQNLKAGYPTKQGHTGTIRQRGLKPKDLIGIPWMPAFALRDDGWYLRQEICWAKSNPMPESVKDRCTRAHETVFMPAKGPRYYYDEEAVAEPMCKGAAGSTFTKGKTGHNGRGRVSVLPRQEHATRNRRSVWTVATTPLSSKTYGVDTEHYAAFPPELVRPMVRAGTSERGVCPQCGAPWRRVVERSAWNARPEVRGNARGPNFLPGRHTTSGLQRIHNTNGQTSGVHTVTSGWQPSCGCDAGQPVPATVLDCFCGSGTTGLVALQEGRRFVGVDLNPDYVELARRRIACAQPPLLNATG